MHGLLHRPTQGREGLQEHGVGEHKVGGHGFVGGHPGAQGLLVYRQTPFPIVHGEHPQFCFGRLVLHGFDVKFGVPDSGGLC